MERVGEGVETSLPAVTEWYSPFSADILFVDLVSSLEGGIRSERLCGDLPREEAPLSEGESQGLLYCENFVLLQKVI